MADVHDFDEHAKARMAKEKAKLDDGTLLKTDKGVTIPCERNARILIGAAPQYAQLHFDEFLDRQRIDDRNWIDADDRVCLDWLQGKENARFNKSHAIGGARFVAEARRRDSLQEWVKALPAWDGIPRIEMAFVDAWGAPDNELQRAASRNFFIALIARAIVPGAQVDTVWCFEGPQGTFKSMALRALGGSFHAEVSAPIGTADFQRELRGLWIAELSELDSIRGREASTVKRILSAPADRFVDKWQTHAQTYLRRAVAVATTNEVAYWEDSTGARRLIPIACGEIHVDVIKAMRIHWFSEAVAAYADHPVWWDYPASVTTAQEERHQVDPWEDILASAIQHGQKREFAADIEWPKEWISTTEIMRDWLNLAASQQGNKSGVRLGKVMRRLGFLPKRDTSGNERGWVPDPKSVRNGTASDEMSDAPIL